MGPSVCGLVEAMKPAPARLQWQSAFVVHELPPCAQCPLPAGLHGGEPDVQVQTPGSPFMSTKEPDAPAVVGSALRMSWLTSSSPSSYVDPGAQVPGGL